MWLQQNGVKSLCMYIMKVSYSLQRSHTHTHTQSTDNTTSYDAFLCDVKLAASGLQGKAQDV